MNTDLLPRDWEDKPVNSPLVDDLADVLAHMVVGNMLQHHPSVVRVMARYRAEKASNGIGPTPEHVEAATKEAEAEMWRRRTQRLKDLGILCDPPDES